MTLKECTCQALFVVENTQKKAGVDVTSVGLVTRDYCKNALQSDVIVQVLD